MQPHRVPIIILPEPEAPGDADAHGIRGPQGALPTSLNSGLMTRVLVCTGWPQFSALGPCNLKGTPGRTAHHVATLMETWSWCHPASHSREMTSGAPPWPSRRPPDAGVHPKHQPSCARVQAALVTRLGGSPTLPRAEATAVVWWPRGVESPRRGGPRPPRGRGLTRPEAGAGRGRRGRAGPQRRRGVASASPAVAALTVPATGSPTVTRAQSLRAGTWCPGHWPPGAALPGPQSRAARWFLVSCARCSRACPRAPAEVGAVLFFWAEGHGLQEATCPARDPLLTAGFRRGGAGGVAGPTPACPDPALQAPAQAPAPGPPGSVHSGCRDRVAHAAHAP